MTDAVNGELVWWTKSSRSLDTHPLKAFIMKSVHSFIICISATMWGGVVSMVDGRLVSCRSCSLSILNNQECDIPDDPHNLGVLCLFTLVEFANHHFIQLPIKGVKWLIFAHLYSLKRVVSICNLVSFTFLVPSYMVSKISHASLAIVTCEIRWNSLSETPQKIAFKVWLLALAATRAALS